MAKRDGSQMGAAYQSIRDKIISYQLAPGALVSDYLLAAELGMSRAPVREAILLLTADGLVETTGGKSRVADIGYADIVDIMEVRRALDREALHNIAQDGWLNEEQLQELQALMDGFAASNDTAVILKNNRYDNNFHTAIIRYGGNRRMLQIVERLNLQMLRARWVNVAVPGRQQDVPAEHHAIFDALARRDLGSAIEANQRHLDNSLSAFRQVFEDPQLRQVMAGLHNFLGDQA